MKKFLIAMSILCSSFCMQGEDPVVVPGKTLDKSEDFFMGWLGEHGIMGVLSFAAGACNEVIKPGTSSGGKAAIDLVFLVANYVLCSGIKYGFMTDAERNALSTRSPHLDGSELAVSFLYNSFGQDLRINITKDPIQSAKTGN